MPAQALALLTSIFYASTLVSARLGLRYSTPITVTAFSVVTQNILLWSAVFLTGGVPAVPRVAVLLFVLLGAMQFAVRMFSYTGVHKIGAARSSALQSVSPLVSTALAVAALSERPHLGVVLGTVMVVGGIVLLSQRVRHQVENFRWWHLLLPLAAACLTGTGQPIRRYALLLAHEPLFFAAVMGAVSLVCLLAYLVFAPAREPLVWNRAAFGPFLFTGAAETLSIVLIMSALSVGTVSVVAPIATTYPLWAMIGAAIFLRGSEPIGWRTALGTLGVVGGTAAVILHS